MVDARKVGVFTLAGAAVVTVIVVVAVLTNKETRKPDNIIMTTRDIVRGVLARMPVIDGHNDFPMNLRSIVLNDLRKVNFSDDLSQHPDWGNVSSSFTDIPRLRKGQVGGQFWVAFTGCDSNYKDSVAQTLEQMDVIKRLVEAYPNDLQFAKSAAEIEDAIANDRIASLIGIEGGHSIQSSFAILRLMYESGARYMTITHNCNLPWADAAPVDGGTLPPVNDGLSPFGLQIIDEMNRLGMMVDLSHVSMATMRAAIQRSRAPVIFSHSSAKAKCNHHRNVPDDILQLIKERNGIVMVNFYKHFVQCDRGLNATIQDVVDHIEHIRAIAGVDAVGIGADYDGIDEVPIGLPDVSAYPALFEALFETGRWTEEELEKLSGRNLLRVFKEVERVRDESIRVPAEQDTVQKADVDRANISLGCVTSKFPDSVKIENGDTVSVPGSSVGNDEKGRVKRETSSPEEEL